MRFKLFYSEKRNCIEINVLTDKSSEIILPENTDQHIYYPIPNELKKEVDKSIQGIVSEQDSLCLTVIDEEINDLIQKRKDTIKQMREKYNPKIMQFCESYKDNYPEWFI